MSLLLNISSDTRLSSETTNNFTVNFAPSVPIPGNWSMGLISASLWYSYYNISPDYNNQTFRYYNRIVWKNIIIVPGLYGLEDINFYIQNQMRINGNYTPGMIFSWWFGWSTDW